jgi:hypothetical protein
LLLVGGGGGDGGGGGGGDGGGWGESQPANNADAMHEDAGRGDNERDKNANVSDEEEAAPVYQSRGRASYR